MAYPTIPALNQSQALNSSLWDGLVWAYLPGYSKTASIAGGDTIGGSSTTTIDTYAEGAGETLDLGEYRVGTTTPLEGTTAATMHSYYRMLWSNDGTMSSVISTAPSTTWQNVGVLGINDSLGTLRGIWRKSGVEVFATSPMTNRNAATNPVVNAITWRDSTTVGVHDFLVAEATVSAASISGSFTGTEPVIVGSYYDKSASRSSNIAYFCGAVWNRTLTPAEKTLLQSDPYAVFQKAAGSPDANAPGGTGTSTGSGSGGTATGGAGGTGTITIPAIKDLTTGALRSSQTGITVIVNDLTTGALVVKKTAQTTDASGNCAVTDALLVAATTYRVTTILADGSEGTWKYAAA